MTLPIVVFWLIIAHTGTIPFDSKAKCDAALHEMQTHAMASKNEMFCLEDSIDIPAIDFLQ